MDLSARLVAERLSARWGQPVVVENRQGADGIPAVTAFLSARDNHTFLFSFAGMVTFNHLLHERLPYDPKELVPVAPVVDNFLGVSATAVLQVNSLADLVAAAKDSARQAQLGRDAGPALLRPARLAEVRRHRDGAGGLSRLRAGLPGPQPGAAARRRHRRADARAASPGGHRQAHRSSPTAHRSPQAPDVPTASGGRLSRAHVRWPVGVYGWRDMPAEIKERIAADTARSSPSPPSARGDEVGTAPRTGTPEEFAAAIEEQRAKIAAIHQATEKPAQ